MGTARGPSGGRMNEIVNIIDRRAGVGRPVRTGKQKQAERGARRERRGVLYAAGVGSRCILDIHLPAGHRLPVSINPSLRKNFLRGNRIDVNFIFCVEKIEITRTYWHMQHLFIQRENNFYKKTEVTENHPTGRLWSKGYYTTDSSEKFH
ncbi:hypothetical protein K0M31_006458 [Melipona bicolor]|uniref:Uncharacterized protein n=1 Tax=Melipona bicolor TaxID=60889 RepID=A0AA40FTQ2_9HYME|nr:hypothetical protein K0M31_006458 [Melipona bicolor]